ncbi:MAG TPA: polymorphic toxin-type HINT domain-containing protein [Polyangia bacterium]
MQLWSIAADLRRAPRPSAGWSDSRGVTVIEKIIIVAVFVFAIVGGVRFLSGGTNQALVCHGQQLLNPNGTTTCVGGGGAAGNDNITAPPKAPAPPRCDGISCMCFVAGTKVVTIGGLVSIEEVTAGTLVLSRSEAGDTTDWRPVLQTFVNQSRSLVRLSTLDADGRTETFETTGNHPFFTERRGWIDARDLVPGADLLIDGEGRPVRLLNADSLDRQVPVYNFEVAEFHTYFIGASAIWVHNRPAAAGDFVNVQWGAGPPVQAEVRRVLSDRTFEVRFAGADGRTITTRVDRNGHVVRSPGPSRAGLDAPLPALPSGANAVPPPLNPRNPGMPSGLEGYQVTPFQPPPRPLGPAGPGVLPLPPGAAPPRPPGVVTPDLGAPPPLVHVPPPLHVPPVIHNPTLPPGAAPPHVPGQPMPGRPVILPPPGTAGYPGSLINEVPYGQNRPPRPALVETLRPGNPVGRIVPIRVPGQAGRINAEIVNSNGNHTYTVRYDDGTGVQLATIRPNGTVVSGPDPVVATVQLVTFIKHVDPIETIRTQRTGHTWVELQFRDPQAIPANWRREHPGHWEALRSNSYRVGFYPDPRLRSSGPTESVPGSLQWEGGHRANDPLSAPHATQSYDLTLSQVEALIRHVDETATTSRYSTCAIGGDRNCTRWAVDAIAATGYRPPDASFMGVLPMPTKLYHSIRKDSLAGRPGAASVPIVTTHAFQFERDSNGVDRTDAEGNLVPQLGPDGRPITRLRETGAPPPAPPPPVEVPASDTASIASTDTTSSVDSLDVPDLPQPPPGRPLGLRERMRGYWHRPANQVRNLFRERARPVARTERPNLAAADNPSVSDLTSEVGGGAALATQTPAARMEIDGDSDDGLGFGPPPAGGQPFAYDSDSDDEFPMRPPAGGAQPAVNRRPIESDSEEDFPMRGGPSMAPPPAAPRVPPLAPLRSPTGSTESGGGDDRILRDGAGYVGGPCG